MRLLIIEDDRDAADYLVKAFREVGHVADHAADGEEGLALALDGELRRADRRSHAAEARRAALIARVARANQSTRRC